MPLEIKSKFNWKKLLPVILIVAIFVPSFTHADGLFGIGTIAGTAVTTVLSYIFTLLREILGSIIYGLIYIFNITVYARAYNNVPVVVAIWKILRDFANMFFILALIYMAFATIFDIGRYRFTDMIWRFLLVAVLINFSLAIGGFIIDAFQVLNNVFLHIIGNPGDRLGIFLNPSVLIKDTTNISAVDVGAAGLLGIIFDVILSGMFAFSLLVADVFGLIRVVAIWGLLMISPIAWMSYILPSTQRFWKKWWGWFMGWNMFLPVYLLMLYISLLFLSQGSQVVAAVTNGGNQPLFGTGNITFNVLFFYLGATGFLAYGTFLASKMVTAFGGNGFQSGLDWARNLVKRTPLPYVGSIESAEKAADARRKQFAKEGFRNPLLNKMYGGEEARKRSEAKALDKFGVGESNAVEKQLASEVGSFKNRFRNKNSEELQQLANSGSNAQKFAARELLKDRKQLTNDQLIDTYNEYGGDNSENARKFAESIDFSKLRKDDRKKWLETVNDIQLKEKVAEAMAEKGDIKDDDAGLAQAVGLASMYISEAERNEFIDKIKKKNVRLALKTQRQLIGTDKKSLLRPKTRDANGNEVELFGNPSIPPEQDAAYNEAFRQAILKMKPADLLEIPIEQLRDDQNKTNEQMRILVQSALNNQKVEHILQNATTDQLSVWEGLMKVQKDNIEKEKNKESDRLANSLYDAMIRFNNKK